MNTLLITTLLTVSPEVNPSVKLSWYGVVPTLVDKKALTQHQLISEYHELHHVTLVKLAI